VITDKARQMSRGFVKPLALALGRVGFTPNMVTVAGSVLHLGVAALLAAGHLSLGGVGLALAAAFDGLDGTLARETGRASKFGAFLDSTLDRVSEILVFGGLLWYVQRQPPATDCRWCQFDGLLVLLALCGSLMVSYTRARSEGIGCGTKAGLLGRLERTAILVVALLLGWLRPGLLIIAVGAWLTVAQRVTDVWRRCGAGGEL
jgi:CDP-diacylglycerol---glycerol-3-phosphate 3-phosphatidyltransferase